MDPDAAQRLWKLTRGNVLYLRNIVEQEVADGRLAQQHGYWQVDRRSDHAAGPGRTDRIPHRCAAAARRRCDRRAGGRGADRNGVAAADHRSGRGRGGRQAWPDHARACRRRRGGAGGASALRRGAPQTRAAQPGLRRLRGLVAAELAASDDSDDMRIVGAPRHVESRLRPHTRRRAARQGSPRRRLAGGSAPGRSAGGGGDPRRRGTGAELCSRACACRGWAAARRPTRCSPRSTPAS